MPSSIAAQLPLYNGARVRVTMSGTEFELQGQADRRQPECAPRGTGRGPTRRRDIGAASGSPAGGRPTRPPPDPSPSLRRAAGRVERPSRSHRRRLHRTAAAARAAAGPLRQGAGEARARSGAGASHYQRKEREHERRGRGHRQPLQHLRHGNCSVHAARCKVHAARCKVHLHVARYICTLHGTPALLTNSRRQHRHWAVCRAHCGCRAHRNTQTSHRN